MIEICPLPLAWNAIYQRMLEVSRERPLISPPPVPLILAAWWAANDVDKQLRWQATLEWADRYDLRALIGELPSISMYCVEQPTSYEMGPMGGPLYLPWTFEAKRRPTPPEREQTLKLLVDNWSDIAGTGIAAATRPLRLTGRKARRLLIAARPDVMPPWGTWTILAPDDRRRHFTRLRAAINATVAPAEIDHVDFVAIDTEADF